MKKIFKVLTLMLMVFVLAGCMKINMNIEVKSDKTMTMAMDILAEESMITSTGGTTEEWVSQIKEQMLSSDEMKKAKVKETSKTIDGSKWVGVNVSGVSGTKGSGITEKDIDGTKSLVLTLPMKDMENQMGGSSLGDLDAYGYSVSKLKALGMEVNVTVKMPGKATTNVGKADGDTVTIDLLELMANGSTQDIVISSPASGGMDMTLIFIGVGVVVIGGIVFFVLKKKKKVSEEPIYNDMPFAPETQTQEEPVQENVQQPITQEEPVQEVEEKPKTEETNKEVVENQRYCPNCGQAVTDENVCPNCGYDLKK